MDPQLVIGVIAALLVLYGLVSSARRRGEDEARDRNARIGTCQRQWDTLGD